MSAAIFKMNSKKLVESDEVEISEMLRIGPKHIYDFNTLCDVSAFALCLHYVWSSTWNCRLQWIWQAFLMNWISMTCEFSWSLFSFLIPFHFSYSRNEHWLNQMRAAEQDAKRKKEMKRRNKAKHTSLKLQVHVIEQQVRCLVVNCLLFANENVSVANRNVFIS
jgi:hypothetical protein